MNLRRLPVWVALGGGALVGLACLVAPSRPATPGVPPPPPKRTASLPTAPEPELPPEPAPQPIEAAPSPEPPRTETPVPAAPVSRKKPEPVDRTPMLFTFERELTLTAEERRHFQSVLEEREAVIEEVHGEIRRTNLLVRSEYAARIEQIQAASYERMGYCLDSLRHRRFQAILAEGRFGDAVAFELPQGIEIRD